MAPQQSGFLTLDGARLEWRRVTPPAPRPTAPTLVLLHEGLGCVAMWKDFPEALASATGCAVFLWSRRGFGRSDPITLPRPLDYLEQETPLVARVLSEAGIHRCVLVGHSDGGTIALLAAGGRAASKIAGVVTMAAHVFVEDVTIDGIHETKRAWDQGDLRRRLARWHGDNVEGAFRGWCDTWLDPAFRAWNIEGALSAVRAPVLVMQGADDQYGTPAQVEAIARGVSGPARPMLIPGAGHAPHIDAPEAVIEAIRFFLAALPLCGANRIAGVNRDLAAEFAALGDRVWLNCAHQGPLPACARAAAEEAVRWKAEPWELTTERFTGVPLRLKRALGRLIGAPAEEIILANSASYGLHLIANGFPFAAGDEVLVMRGDFPSDILPWLGLEPRGVVTRQLAPRSGRVLQIDDVRAAIGPRTRLLCLTWVHSLSGWTIDMDVLGRLCREHGIAFILNVSQALGARALDVASAPVDAIVCAGWKWLLGPYATGFCWIRPDLLRRLTCQQTYWLTMLNADDLGREQLDLTLRNDAGAARWDVFATANFINFNALAASVELLLEYGVAAAAAHDAALVQRLIDGLDRRRYRLTSPEAGPARSTLVFVEPRDRECVAEMQQALAGVGIHVAHRAGALRLAPHLYNTSSDIDRGLAALQALA